MSNGIVIVTNMTPYNWQSVPEVGKEQSDYSIISATTYINPEMTIVKKVQHDGMIEYYYTA